MSERIYSVSAAVLVYGMAATLMVSLVLAAIMGWLAWSSMTELSSIQAEIGAAHNSLRVSRIALERCDAKLEIVDTWILGARGETSKLSTGGN